MGTSRNTYNAVVYYENNVFNARLAYAFRSKFFNGLDRSTAQHQHLGDVHYWSLDRDMPCPGANDVTSTCHSLAGVASRSFISAFAAGLH